MDDITEKRNEILQAVSDGMTNELAADLVRVSADELKYRLTWDEEFAKDVRQARAEGIHYVLKQMLSSTTGQNYWIQRVPRTFEYMLDKDRAARVDADVFNDGAVIEFKDNVTSAIHDENLA